MIKKNMIKILRLQAAELKKHNIVQKVLVNLAAQNETKILLKNKYIIATYLRVWVAMMVNQAIPTKKLHVQIVSWNYQQTKLLLTLYNVIGIPQSAKYVEK